MLFRSYTPIEARLEPFARGLKQAEGMAREGAKKIEKASAVNLGATGGGIGRQGGFLESGFKFAAGIQATASAFRVANIGVELYQGNMTKAKESLFQMPFGIGQVAQAFDQLLDAIEGGVDGLTEMQFRQAAIAKQARESIRERATDRRRGLGAEVGMAGLEGSDAAKAQVQAEKSRRIATLIKEEREAFRQGIDLRKEFAAEREQVEEISRKKIESIDRKDKESADKLANEKQEKERKQAEDSLKLKEQQFDELTTLKDRNDVMDLDRTDKVAGERLSIEREAEAAIRKATKDGNAQLIPEIERQKALRLAGVGAGGLADRGQQIDDISRMAIGSGANIRAAAKQEEPVTKKQGETQIGVLRDMLSAITRLRMEATAN